MFNFRLIPVANSKGDFNCLFQGDGYDVTVGFGLKAVVAMTTFKDGSYNDLEVYGTVEDRNHRIHMVNGRRVPR